MIDVRFRNEGEIRMGSPFNTYRIRLKGEWVPDLEEYGWQRPRAKSPDGRYLVLTAWDTTDNTPGFYFVLVDAVKRAHVKTGVFAGCCTSLKWKGDHLLWEAWSAHGERTGWLQLPESLEAVLGKKIK